MILNYFKPYNYKDKEIYKKSVETFHKFNPGKSLSDDKYYETFLKIIFKFNVTSLSIFKDGIKAHIRYGLRNPEFILDYVFKELDSKGNTVEYETLFIGTHVGETNYITESKLDYDDIIKNLKYLIDKL